MTPPEHGAFIDGVVRQSTLKTYDQCPMRAVAEAQSFDDFSTPPAALGTAFHMVAEEILRTLRVQGEQSIPTQEAIEVAREIIARPDCPHLSNAQLHELRILVLQFAALKWPASAIIAIEDRLWCMVPCPDGRERKITGKPDVLLADPPGGAVCLDFKTGWSVPPTPRDGDFSRDGGRPYLSERGTFQLDTLGLLIMRGYPAIDHVTLREYFPRLNEMREATLRRDELEHVEQHLGLLAFRFARDFPRRRNLIEARPGKWCSHCPIARECPVPDGEREPGTLHDDQTADAEAARFVAVDALRNDLRAALKNYHEETGYFPAIGDGQVIGWQRSQNTGKRSFGPHIPQPPAVDDTDYVALLQASVEKAEAEKHG